MNDLFIDAVQRSTDEVELAYMNQLLDEDDVMRPAAEVDLPFCATPILICKEEHVELASIGRAAVEMLEECRGILGTLTSTEIEGLLGLAPLDISLARRTASAISGTQLARVDMYYTDAGWQIVEINLGAVIGGLDIADLNNAQESMLRFAPNAAYEHDDPLEAVASLIAREASPSANKTVAVMDWSTYSDQSSMEARRIARVFRRLGLRAFAGDTGDVRLVGGRLLCRGLATDLVYRMFMSEDIHEEYDEAEAVLHALAGSGAGMMTGFDAEILSSKAMFAAVQGALGPELSGESGDFVGRFLPTTTLLNSSASHDWPTNGLRGRGRHDLVLKPVAGSWSQGVVVGACVDEATWSEEFRLAVGSGTGYVLQDEIRPQLDDVLLFDREAKLERAGRRLQWSLFMVGGELRGIWVHAQPGSDRGPALASRGTSYGCVSVASASTTGSHA